MEEASCSKDSDSPHAYLYKYKDKKQSQHERRIKFLEEQKEKRSQELDKSRHIYDTYLKDIESIPSEVECEDMETESRQQCSVKFKLMLTEWFVDIPEDLAENWLVKCTPEGYRVLIISKNRSTSVYNYKGNFIFKTKTNFPGGARSNSQGTTVLDAVYNRHIKSFYILDCLFWNSLFTLDSEATFRFYWLKTKFAEMPELSKSVNKKLKFILIDSFPAEKAVIQDKMFDIIKVKNKEILYDGVVFYHKESQYCFGYTPLVTWLNSYMLPEKLGVDIPEVYHLKIPEGYVNLEHFIENIDMFKKQKKSKHDSSMEM